ncbi:hypothetical protein C8Q73DRAFT_49397 [Cubamyces lactineus]|nr:hypothetical protein C8Q73DRAFT_49397 [Cubamyces lactineus]
MSRRADASPHEPEAKSRYPGASAARPRARRAATGPRMLPSSALARSSRRHSAHPAPSLPVPPALGKSPSLLCQTIAMSAVPPRQTAHLVSTHLTPAIILDSPSRDGGPHCRCTSSSRSLSSPFRTPPLNQPIPLRLPPKLPRGKIHARGNDLGRACERLTRSSAVKAEREMDPACPPQTSHVSDPCRGESQGTPFCGVLGTRSRLRRSPMPASVLLIHDKTPRRRG